MAFHLQGPFATFDIKPADGQDAKWTNMTFSPDGRHILVMTAGEHMRLIDAFSGELVQTLAGHKNDSVRGTSRIKARAAPPLSGRDIKRLLFALLQFCVLRRQRRDANGMET